MPVEGRKVVVACKRQLGTTEPAACDTPLDVSGAPLRARTLESQAFALSSVPKS